MELHNISGCVWLSCVHAVVVIANGHKHLQVAKDDLIGGSRMKRHRRCVQRAIPLIGSSGVDWITGWIKDIQGVGMHGVDFIALGVVSSASWMGGLGG